MADLTPETALAMAVEHGNRLPATADALREMWEYDSGRHTKDVALVRAAAIQLALSLIGFEVRRKGCPEADRDAWKARAEKAEVELLKEQAFAKAIHAKLDEMRAGRGDALARATQAEAQAAAMRTAYVAWGKGECSSVAVPIEEECACCNDARDGLGPSMSEAAGRALLAELEALRKLEAAARAYRDAVASYYESPREMRAALADAHGVLGASLFAVDKARKGET